MTPRQGQIGDLFPITGLSAVSTAAASAVPTEDLETGPFLIIHLEPTGTITNTSVTVSVALVDSSGKEIWCEAQELGVRTVDGTTRIARGIFELFRATRYRVAVESAITGGGTVGVFGALGVL
jgi:hypothetical protein